MGRTIVLFLSFFFVLGGVARAQTGDPSGAPTPAVNQQWEFSLMLYGWIPGISADTAAEGASADVSHFPIDILEDLSGALMVHAEVTHKPFTLIGDFLYVSFEDDSVGPRGASGFELEGTILDLAVTACVGQWPVGNHGTIALEPLVGARLCDLELALDIGTAEGDVSNSWVDPIVGARAIIDLGEQWRINLRGDLGGFGVGSDFTWFVDASVAYTIGHGIYAAVGYRALGLDFSDGSGNSRFAFDGVLHGPYVGVGVRF